MALIHAVALDLGSGSGRSILGTFDGETLQAKECYRFPNTVIQSPAHLMWDVSGLLDHAAQGIRRAADMARAIDGEAQLASVGIDTWGVDYGLLDRDGRLLANPHTYRDKRTSRTGARFDLAVTAQETFRATGIESSAINTANQLFAELVEDPGIRDRARSMLLMPDLLNYMLCGRRASSYSMASTTSLMRAGRALWDGDLLARLGIPEEWLSPISREPGLLGRIPASHAARLEIPVLEVVHAGAHDTAAAIHAIPWSAQGSSPGAGDGAEAYLSCGSWSIVGLRSAEPVVTEAARLSGFTNEGGLDGEVLLQKNITGLWLLQQAQRHWGENGLPSDIVELVEVARRAPSLELLIDPNDSRLFDPGDIPSHISAQCLQRFGRVPTDQGHMVRVIVESLAMAYRIGVRELQDVSGRRIECVRLVGGGARNELLGQLTADATGLPVIAGPIEASAIGNLLAQLRAMGHLASSKEALEVARACTVTTTYVPQGDCDRWSEAEALVASRS